METHSTQMVMVFEAHMVDCFSSNEIAGALIAREWNYGAEDALYLRIGLLYLEMARMTARKL